MYQVLDMDMIQWIIGSNSYEKVVSLEARNGPSFDFVIGVSSIV